jgi:hypothetical protein
MAESNQNNLIKSVRTRLLSEAPNSFIRGISINVPEFFEDPAFMAWLNNPDNKVFTWHTKGDEPGEYSDVVVTLEGSLNGEGSDSDMPEYCWDLILEACRQHLGEDSRYNIRFYVTLTNLQL